MGMASPEVDPLFTQWLEERTQHKGRSICKGRMQRDVALDRYQGMPEQSTKEAPEGRSTPRGETGRGREKRNSTP